MQHATTPPRPLGTACRHTTQARAWRPSARAKVLLALGVLMTIILLTAMALLSDPKPPQPAPPPQQGTGTWVLVAPAAEKAPPSSG